MTSKDMIISLWKQGYDTATIAKRISATTGKDWKEYQVHKIITAERQQRRGFTTIQGGAANG